MKEELRREELHRCPYCGARIELVRHGPRSEGDRRTLAAAHEEPECEKWKAFCATHGELASRSEMQTLTEFVESAADERMSRNVDAIRAFFETLGPPEEVLPVAFLVVATVHAQICRQRGGIKQFASYRDRWRALESRVLREAWRVAGEMEAELAKHPEPKQ